MSTAHRLDRADDSATPILVFGLSRGTYHHGALGIARSAGRLGIPVHRLAIERRAPAALSRYARGWHTLPEHPTDAQALSALHRLADDIGRAVLVAVDDAASVFVEEHADALATDFLFPRQPAGLAAALASKREMYELCMRHNIPTPASAFPECERDVLDQADRMGSPIVLKCINAGDAPPGTPRVVIAGDRDELLGAYRLMSVPGIHNVMLQEYVPGAPETVWMFNGYFDSGSDCKLGFTGQKIRQAPPYTGVTTLGVCLPNPTVQEATERLMKAVGYRGILDIGYRFDRRDGRYKLLDVNPRIGGTFRLFVGDDGADVLRACYLDLTGREVPRSALPEGRRWVVDPQDLASSLVYYRRGDIDLRTWLRSFGGVRETAWFAIDDPLPFLALWAWLFLDWVPRRLAGKLFKKRR